MDELRKRFLIEAGIGGWEVLVVAVRLLNGAIETITNYQEVRGKIDYYVNAYDDEFRLEVNSGIQIVGYMLV
jgi:hypothetical protein